MPKSDIGAAFKPVDDHNRIGIPKQMCVSIPWISGKAVIPVFLLMLRTTRYRVITAVEAESSEDLVGLREHINRSSDEPRHSILGFNDDASTVIGIHLLKTDLRPPPPEWRLQLPGIVTDLMRIRPGAGKAVVVLDRERIEIWSVERFESSFDAPLVDPY